MKDIACIVRESFERIAEAIRRFLRAAARAAHKIAYALPQRARCAVFGLHQSPPAAVICADGTVVRSCARCGSPIDVARMPVTVGVDVDGAHLYVALPLGASPLLLGVEDGVTIMNGPL